MKPNIINEIKTLEVKIGKRLFQEAKLQEIKRPPSPLQAKILKYILDHKEEVVCGKDLENYLHVSKATISEVLMAMEKSAIIKRISIPDDARAKRIVLTDTSLERFQELEKNFQSINEELLHGVSKKELECFLNVLQKMKNNI
ncbi:MAG TPA: hypothetical protein IAB49_03025 [Candidatus Caccenecus avistercoris]|nr:hypothetical protein [Candidatus Caccenecus avistercoris]